MKKHKRFVWFGAATIALLLSLSSVSRAYDVTWDFLGAPMGDTTVSAIYIDPDDDDTWYVTSSNGIYITRNAGTSWENHLSGDSRGFAIDPNNPNRLYASSEYELYRSLDKGEHWTLIVRLSEFIRSAHVRETDSSVLVGVNWIGSSIPNGVYKSTNFGVDWGLYDFDYAEDNLLLWDIEEDPVNDILYVGTEIADHPDPYEPPLFRSTNGGVTWTEIAGTIPWHVGKLQVHPTTQDVYALTESLGLYRSTNSGHDWTFLNNEFFLDLLIDRNLPSRFFGGGHTWGSWDGGVFGSSDAGQSFEMIGLFGEIVSGLALDNPSMWLYAACYDTGIYRGRLPRVWHVRPDGLGDVPTIQDAVDLAVDGDTVLLADGTFSGVGNYDVVISGKSIQIQSESGDAPSCVIDCQGQGRGIYCIGADSGTRLQGFTIASGSATGTGYDLLGGAALFVNSTDGPVVENCIFLECYAEGHGGAVHGGFRGEPVFRDCQFISNTCGSFGGGFIGGFGEEVCSPSFYDCIFIRNTAPAGGGGAISVVGDAGSCVLSRCVFGGNEANGGGAVRTGVGTFSADSCTFAFNSSPSGGGLSASEGHMTIANSIVAFSSEGTAIFCSGEGTAELICCDVYGNDGGDWVGCIAGQETLNGNLTADPLFCDPILEDYGLDDDSPCLPANNSCGTQMGALGQDCTTVDVEFSWPVISVQFAQNRPNPFNPRTTLSFTLPSTAGVTLAVYDLAGRKIVTLLNEIREAGRHEVVWHSVDDAGVEVASGIYLAKLRTLEGERSVRLSLVR